jgi:hypothetical protein
MHVDWRLVALVWGIVLGGIAVVSVLIWELGKAVIGINF